jgi:hypothetical protein
VRNRPCRRAVTNCPLPRLLSRVVVFSGAVGETVIFLDESSEIGAKRSPQMSVPKIEILQVQRNSAMVSLVPRVKILTRRLFNEDIKSA